MGKEVSTLFVFVSIQKTEIIHTKSYKKYHGFVTVNVMNV